MTNPSPFFCLPNLASHTLEQQDPGAFKHPGYNFADKRAFRAWCTRQDTRHFFFNLTEGLNANLRVSSENPPQFLHGIVADYDASMKDDAFDSALARAPKSCAPMYASRTFSGGVRLVWLFERPLPIHSVAILKRVLKKAKSSLKLTTLLPGLDEEAFMDVCRYYEVGINWTALEPAPISSEKTWRWVESSSRQKDFKRLAESIPIDVIRQEVEKRFPGRWQGLFELGSRGVRFWDSQADAQSVIIRETGCQCFTGTKPFMSWADIFGPEFVERFQEKKIGGAIEDLYFDGRHYWRKLPDTSWQAMNSTTVARHLRVEYALDPDPHGQPSSELDRVLHEIEEKKAIVGAMPFVHHKDTLIYLNRKPYLNTSTTKCLQPVSEPQPWAKNFPFIADYLERLLEDKPLNFLLSWLQRFYKSAWEGKLLKGQAVFLAGPVGVGKTLLSERLIAPLLGGKQEATDFLLGGSNFNKELFEYALWTIDDDPVSGDPKAHMRFSNLVKKVVANHTFNYHAKFRDQLTVPWNGRILVTCNDDPESIRILPDLDVSIKDKLILLKTSPNAQRRFPKDLVNTIDKELPYFARWLIDYEIPSECEGENRFGIGSYIDPELEEIARQSSVTNSFAEILDMWRKNYFKVSRDLLWKGTAAELNCELVTDETVKPLVQKTFNTITIGRRLCAMVNQGYFWIEQRRSRTDGRRVFTIHSQASQELLTQKTSEENQNENPF